MVSVKSLIKRKFKQDYFPKGVYMDLDKINTRLMGVLFEDDEEVVVAIDNEPHKDDIDYVLLTTQRMIIAKDDFKKSIYYKDIKSLELPEEKMNNSLDNGDFKMNRSDKARICLENGEVEQIRMIYGGIYLLATVLKNPIMNEL